MKERPDTSRTHPSVPPPRCCLLSCLVRHGGVGRGVGHAGGVLQLGQEVAPHADLHMPIDEGGHQQRGAKTTRRKHDDTTTPEKRPREKKKERRRVKLSCPVLVCQGKDRKTNGLSTVRRAAMCSILLRCWPATAEIFAVARMFAQSADLEMHPEEGGGSDHCENMTTHHYHHNRQQLRFNNVDTRHDHSPVPLPSAPGSQGRKSSRCGGRRRGESVFPQNIQK